MLLRARARTGVGGCGELRLIMTSIADGVVGRGASATSLDALAHRTRSRAGFAGPHEVFLRGKCRSALAISAEVNLVVTCGACSTCPVGRGANDPCTTPNDTVCEDCMA